MPVPKIVGGAAAATTASAIGPAPGPIRQGDPHRRRLLRLLRPKVRRHLLGHQRPRHQGRRRAGPPAGAPGRLCPVVRHPLGGQVSHERARAVVIARFRRHTSRQSRARQVSLRDVGCASIVMGQGAGPGGRRADPSVTLPGAGPRDPGRSLRAPRG